MVSAKQRQGRDQEDRPAVAGEQLRQRRENHPGGWRVAGPGDLRRTTSSWWQSTAISTSLASGDWPKPTRQRTCRRTIKARVRTTMASSWRVDTMPGQSHDAELAPFSHPPRSNTRMCPSVWLRRHDHVDTGGGEGIGEFVVRRAVRDQCRHGFETCYVGECVAAELR
jgi:hypothetical protein